MVWFRVKPQNREDSIRISIEYAEGSISDVPGCRRHDANRFSYYKIFDDDEAFEDHTQTESFRAAHAKETKTWLVDARLAFTTPIFPFGDVRWDSTEQSGGKDEGANHGLYIYHGTLIFHPDRVDDAQEALVMDAQTSLEQERGCLRFDVHQTRENPTEFWLYQVYASRGGQKTC